MLFSESSCSSDASRVQVNRILMITVTGQKIVETLYCTIKKDY